jgi:hypothetical protein
VYAVDVALVPVTVTPGRELENHHFQAQMSISNVPKLRTTKRALLEMNKFPLFPFLLLRHLDDVPPSATLNSECVSHGLLTPCPSLHDHSGVVAHFKCTVLLLPSGNGAGDWTFYGKDGNEPMKRRKEVFEGARRRKRPEGGAKGGQENKKRLANNR